MRTVVVIFDCFGARHCEERSNPGDFGSVVFIVFDLRCIAIIYQNDEKAKKNPQINGELPTRLYIR